jgi:hypothetical protein
VAWVRRLLANSRAPARHHRLYVQLGYLAGILAQLPLAPGDHDATQADRAAAMRAAEAVGDGQLRAWILSIQAMLAAYANRHQDVVGLTTAGLEAAGQQASATAVELASLQARAHATLGDRPAAKAALARARQTLTLVPPEAQDRGLFAFPEEKLASHEGQLWRQLGAPERAQEPLQRALRLLDGATGARRSPVDQAMVRLHLARSMLSLASSTRHASRQNRHWPCIASVRSTTPGAAPVSLRRCSSRTTRPRRPRGFSRNSPEPSCAAVRLRALGIQVNLGALPPTRQLGDDPRSRQSTIKRHPSHHTAGPRCSLEVSLPLQGRPCGRPPAAAVLGRQHGPSTPLIIHGGAHRNKT